MRVASNVLPRERHTLPPMVAVSTLRITGELFKCVLCYSGKVWVTWAVSQKVEPALLLNGGLR